ncbi:MAG: redox-sensing transcriptional repressor Rex [Verrucomicrobiae bacterium]|nr:redox-sensing transcriptional repressor Rex [Verrucomicrobiae bacterium]NNJ86328.1 redox-sensing transcriptional repressor Rex [Akkermansiaceae bacterium]
MGKPVIPQKSIYRISLYGRCLERLRENGHDMVSSTALAAAAGVKPSQLRRDLAYLGTFGTRGRGYRVEALKQAIHEGLGRAKLQPIIMVGAGNLGRALLRYDGFRKEGYEILAAFDSAAETLKGRDLPVAVHPSDELPEFIRTNKVQIAVLCVPANHAQEVTNTLVDAGIQGILNFSPVVLQVTPEVTVNNVDLALELENVNYFIRKK